MGDATDNAKALRVGEFGVQNHQQAIIDEIVRRFGEYEQWLGDRLEDRRAVVKTPQIDPLSSRIADATAAPYRKDRKDDGLRDTFIWFTAVAVAEDNPGETVWFLSDNHRDFGPEQTDKTGANPNEACPFPLHPELVEDLDDKGLTGRVQYVVKMDRLIRYLEALFEPIEDAELSRRTSEFDLSALAEMVVASLDCIDVDPQRAALPLTTQMGMVVGAQTPTEGWQFSEGAGCGEGGWTARFSVTTEVDLMLSGEGGNVAATKHLQVSGDLMVSPDGEIQGVVVTSLDALPDDPMRARWERRAQRAADGSKMWFGLDKTLYSPSVKEALSKIAEDRLAGMAGVSDVANWQWGQLAGSTSSAKALADAVAERTVLANSFPGDRSIADMIAKIEKDQSVATANILNDAAALGTTSLAQGVANSSSAKALADAVAERTVLAQQAGMPSSILEGSPLVDAITKIEKDRSSAIADAITRIEKDRSSAIADMLNGAATLGATSVALPYLQAQARSEASEDVSDSDQDDFEPDSPNE